ncbi:hypothetical protein CANINC_001925 [Pichia inconspicua]|uniref:glycogenin glucosyltransferase n=1 Tax=Pichia inconspicua TaxID=52247 RepID=A0A4V4NFV2_9ASCO|nr:hypothetical protein CANINC_001925 [[Candida] inconspicua]
MTKIAYVTLLLNTDYLPGTLTVVQSLRQTGSTVPIILLVSKKNVSKEAYDLILESCFFERIIDVDSYLLESRNRFELNDLLKRLDLSLTLTKLNVWRLTDYERFVYLDSDIHVYQNIDSLFHILPELSSHDIIAASDSGWPDIFNSGLFALKPSNEVFNELLQFYNDNNSFDGADQGLLNEYFNLQSQKTHANWFRLPFTFNCTLNSNYEYLPAMVRFRDSIKVFHFIGSQKPWKNHNLCYDTQYAKIFNNYNDNLYQLWWKAFESIDIGDYTSIEILEISNNLQTKFSSLTLNTPSYKQREIEFQGDTKIHENEKHKGKCTEIYHDNEISNPFLSPTKPESEKTLHFPTFYYKKPSNTAQIKDESKLGEAYRMSEGKVEWPKPKSPILPKIIVQKASDKVQDPIKEKVERAFESHLDKYIHEHPIFPWEKETHIVTRTFENTVKYEPPAYSISVMSTEEDIKKIIGEVKDDRNLVGFSDGETFEKYLNQVEEISSSTASSASLSSSEISNSEKKRTV